ncbi:LAME_0B04544g1_1 [Lachancea meyersii CBS 8951]|uniref:LAME_0B04544g1_1 n=1 Tax=Lachancea meyersii CBS 8951 TaxID=1266667 RepID=A0A1G4IUT7_9SACH|nr:LAME_0B04544g1_1 [Lachancea meyersii CBS 8951]
MTKDATAPNRRRAIRKVNYNERDADEDVVRRIQLMEKNREASTVSAANKVKVPKGKHQEYLNNKSIAWNFIPTLPTTFRKHSRFSNILDLENAEVDVKNDILSNGPSVLLKRDDHIYMVSEPPGEPYYIGRIVQFVPKAEYSQLIEEGKKYTTSFPARYFQAKMNWYYRPRDVQEKALNVNPRLVYASLHMDLCPLHSYRGKCTVVHKTTLDLPDEAQYETLMKPNTFFYEQLFDRYTLQYYDVWNTKKQLLPLAPNSTYISTLAKLYPFVFVEEQYPLQQVIQKYVLGKKVPNERNWDLKCAECGGWCEKNQCVQCDECHLTVHLYCLDPPLERRPAKGVIWVCSKCLSHSNNDQGNNNWEPIDDKLTNFSQSACLAKLTENIWFHYLGSKIVDNLIDVLSPELLLAYPIKKLRTGSKYQWNGCERESWKPMPYEEIDSGRGADDEAGLLWRSNDNKISESELDKYVDKCQKKFPEKLQILPQACNFWDMILNTLMLNDYNAAASLKVCARKLSRESLREPTFSEKEIIKFEEGIAKHGSELHPVCKHVGTQSMGMIVRFYYYWKKTPNGRRIWGNFEGRKKNQNKGLMGSKKKTEDINKLPRVRKPSKISKEIETAKSKEWKHIDDSSFDSEKISTLKTYFKCMFCEVDYSPLWYRVTGGCDDDHIKTRMITGVNEKTSTSDKLPRRAHHSDSSPQLEALCIRCARLWRRYAVKWLSPMDVVKKLNGKYSSSVRAALDLLLSESNDTTIKVPPGVLSEKCVEWELVQDAELIIKQRLHIIQDPDRFAKMKRNCLSVHAQLNKVVKRLVEKDGHSEERMMQKLENFIGGLVSEAQKEEKKAKLKKIREQAAQKRIKLTAQGSPKTAVNHSQTDNKILPTGETLKNGIVKEPLPKEKKAEARIKQELWVPTGDKVVDVFVGGGKNMIGQIKVDENFETLRLSEDLYMYVFKLDQQSESPIVQHQQRATEEKKRQDKLKPSMPNELSKSPDYSTLQITNASNIPVISDHNFAAILDAYHSHNPLYHEWSQGRLPKFNYDQLMRITTSKNVVVSNHIGRRAKSPFPATNAIEEDETAERRDFCCVCLQKFREDRDEEINCRNCGLNVHYFCYGVDVPDRSRTQKERGSLKNFQWLCDPCTNNLNPIFTDDYQCCLCNAREVDHEGARMQLRKSTPDALKVTSTEQWCHASCSLLNDSIVYNAPAKLQCASNITDTLLKNEKMVCALCDGIGGGLVKCAFCPVQCHVTCAQDSEAYKFRFLKTPATHKSEKAKILEIDGGLFEIKPILVCPDHVEMSMGSHLPLDHRTKRGITLLEFYCKNYKTAKELEVGPVKMAVAEMRARTPKPSDMSGREDGIEKAFAESIVAQEKQCVHCNCRISIFWYGDVCHSCHNNIPSLDAGLLSEEEEHDNENHEFERLRVLKLEEEFLKDIIVEPSSVRSATPSRVKRPRASGPSKGRKKTKNLKEEGPVLLPENTSVVVQSPLEKSGQITKIT